ncbi:MAG: HD domain-containing protein [Bacteroidales bacterium]|nr:HD domain-containing protein [Bacteroidales bacterium]
MAKIDHNILVETEAFVTKLLNNELSEHCHYHTINHTTDVVRNAEIIGEYTGLDQESKDILKVSAWFHDVGYIDSYENHEKRSAEYAETFLRLKEIDEPIINQVTRSIMATRMPQQPEDLISKILCDADLMNMTFEDYIEHIELMRREWVKIKKIKINDHKAYIASLEFFKSHQFHSDYGLKVLQPKKEKTEALIREKINMTKG